MRTTDFSAAPRQAQATAMFIGATKYRSPLSIFTLSRTWFRLVRDLKRMRGYCWHKVYWEFPFTLGTMAFFTDRDAMLAFSRSRHHRALMQWVCDGDRNANGGWIRLYSADPGGYANGVWRAEENVMQHIETFTPMSGEEVGPPVVRR